MRTQYPVPITFRARVELRFNQGICSSGDGDDSAPTLQSYNISLHLSKSFKIIQPPILHVG